MAGSFNLSVIIGAVDQFTAPIQRLSQMLNNLTAPFRRLTARVRALGEAAGINRLAGAIGGVSRRVGGLFQSLGQLGGRLSLLTGGAGAGVGLLASQFASAGKEVQEMADRLEISPQYLQEMIGAADRFNVAPDALIDGIKELQIRTDEWVRTGAGGGSEMFERLGFSRKELGLIQGDTEKLFETVAAKLRTVTDAAARQRIFDEIFGGQGGEQLINFLSQPIEDIQRLREELRELGVTMDEEAIKVAKEYGGGLTRLKNIMVGLRNVIATAVLPVLGDLLEEFTDFMVELRKSDGFATFVQQMRDGVPTFDEVVGWLVETQEKLQPLMDAFNWASDTFGQTETILGVLAATIGGPVIASLLLLTGSLISLGSAILFTPIGWLLAGLALLAGAAYLIYDNWDGITEWWSGMWADVTAAFDEGFISGILELLKTFNPVALVAKAINGIVEWMTGASIMQHLSNAGSAIVDAIKDGIASAWDGLTGWFKGKIDALADMVPGWMKFGDGDEGPTGGNTGLAGTGSTSELLGLAGRQAAATAPPGRSTSETDIRVKFDNMPAGARYEVDSKGDAGVSVETGRSMDGP